MSFISYAQNLEDVMLWRALKHINGGFYVDLGAWSPDIDSVTRAFYESGWQGINIEPNPDFHALLLERRPKDINLKLAISDTPGSLEMCVVENPGLSTLDPEIARIHQVAGWSVKTQLVDVKTLQQIWEEHIPQGQDVHFLKIDIEGLEDAAIQANDWTSNRPWVIVVEATLPMSKVESHHTWEPMLIQARYSFAYADGLNRFYVANEHSELLPAFKYPPNFFDEYTTANQVESAQRAAIAEASVADAIQRANHAESQTTLARDQADAYLNQATQAISQANTAIAQSIQANDRANLAETQAAQANDRANLAETQAAQANDRANQQYQAVVNSRSWKLTKPLRLASKFTQWFARGSIAWLTLKPGSCPRRIVRKGLIWIMNKVLLNPVIKGRALAWLSKYPKLKYRLRAIAYSQTQVNAQRSATIVDQYFIQDKNTYNLSPRAQEIYADLKLAIEKRNQEGL